MIYNLDIPLLVARYAPNWFRHPRNIAFGVVLLAGVRSIHQVFMAWRQSTILDQYRFNGLIHSLEWVLNDRFDALQRRIYITVVDQVPVMYHLGDGEPSATGYQTEGTLTGYYHLATGAVVEPYLYEFLVNVPAAISFNRQQMFDVLDLYRFAGRRPAIRRFGDDDVTVEVIYYPGLAPAANEPILADPSFDSGTG